MISIVVPAFNEEQILPQLYQRLEGAAASWGEDYEIIVVDDGSRDRTAPICSAFCRDNPRWKRITFARNFGHQPAVSAGLYYAQGDAVVVIDADLQDPPEVIGQLIDRWREGFQVVYAIRRKRKEHLLKRAAYAAFYRILSRMATIDIPLDAGDFCLMDRAVVDVLKAMPERSRFIRGMRTWVGFRQTGLAYERAARGAGEPKYTLRKLFRLASDGVMSFSSMPLRLASWLGALMFFMSLALVAVIVLWWLTDATIFGITPRNVAGWTSLFSTILALSGLQLMMIGLLGEYVSRIFDEVKQRPLWVVAETQGLDNGVLDDAQATAGSVLKSTALEACR
jgi:dolichol-phosphate mannosyltransferase